MQIAKVRCYPTLVFLVMLSGITASWSAEPSAAATQVSSKLEASSAAAPAVRKEPDVIFVPTPQEMVDKMLEMAQIKKGDVVYDLGCGDGRIVVTAAKQYGVKAVGFDIDPQRLKESREKVKKNGVEHLVTIKDADIFTLDLSAASVVTLYLLPELNVRLIPQLERMKPGSRIVSYSFEMEGMKPDQVFQEGSEVIYKWSVPLQREGAGKPAGSGR